MPSLPSSEYQPELIEDLLIAVAEGQEDVIEEAFGRIESLLKNPTTEEVSRLATELERATGCTYRTAAGVLRFLAGVAIDSVYSDESAIIEEVTNSFSTALASEGIELAPGTDSRLFQMVRRVLNRTDASARAIEIGAATRGVLPMFEGVSATIELRSSRGYYDLNAEKQNQPLELIPLASIRLDLDSGVPDAICFQATEENLESLRQTIEDLQKGLRTLKGRVKVVTS